MKVFVTPGKIGTIAEIKPLVLTPEAEKAKEEKKDEDVEEKDPFAGGYEVELAFSAPTRLETAARSLRNEIAKLQTYGDDESKVKNLIKMEGTEKAEQTEEQAKTGAEYNKVKVKVRKDMSQEDLQLADGQWVFFDTALKRVGTADAGAAKPLTDVFVASENLLTVMDRVTGLYASLKT